ncbi:MAG: 30S ribosomal protein S5 [Planctomycetes bacterium]|nr:30S ribosomal protein S5 [Planctomycetota bacterium]
MGQRISARDIDLGEEKVVQVNRTSAVVKGGRRFSFSAIVIIGDRKGVVGYGQGKAREVPVSIEKAVRDARKNLVKYPLRGDTIPHAVWGRFRSSRVLLRPAAPGTGIKAGASVRAVVEELGIRNILTKIYGSRNPVNIVKAVLNGLDQLLSKKEVFELRGLPVHPDREGPKLEPVGHEDDDSRKKGRKGGRGGRDGGKGGPSRGRGGKPRGEGKPEAKAETKPDVKEEKNPEAEAPKAEGKKPESTGEDKGGE